MSNRPKNPVRNTKARQDLGASQNIKYNDYAGADKVILVEPVVLRPVAGGEAVGAGKYVKVTGTSYTLDLVGRAYDTGTVYQKGDIVSQATDIYLCNQDSVTGTFDVSKWTKVAPKQVGPVTIAAGSVVCTGQWHNTVTVAGFLVADDSDFRHIRTRD